MQDCIFCKISRGEISSKVRFEDEDFIVVEDINPKAKCHCVAIPKRHFSQLADMDSQDAAMLARIFQRIPKAIEALGLTNGFRLIINQGADAGQTVFHLHIHIMGGEKLADF